MDLLAAAEEARLARVDEGYDSDNSWNGDDTEDNRLQDVLPPLDPEFLTKLEHDMLFGELSESDTDSEPDVDEFKPEIPSTQPIQLPNSVPEPSQPSSRKRKRRNKAQQEKKNAYKRELRGKKRIRSLSQKYDTAVARRRADEAQVHGLGREVCGIYFSGG